MSNGTREEFYKKIANDVVEFYVKIRDLENNSIVKRVEKEDHLIPDTIIASLNPAEDLKNYTKVDCKYREVDYISEKAKKMLEENNGKISLRYDHMIPKNLYLKEIKNECLNTENSKEELKNKIYDIFVSKYYVATITEDENKKLSDSGLGNKMPENCDKNDKFARYTYTKVGIKLLETSLFSKK